MTSTTSRTRYEPQRTELAQLFEKLPPQALEAEMALLGSMILDWQVIGDVVQLVRSADDFADPRHGSIFQTLIDLYDQSQSIDLVQLKQRLDDLSLLDQIGGVEFLVEIAESVPHAASAPYYAEIVRDKALIRRLIDTAGKILQEAHTSAEGAADQLDAAEKAIFLLRDADVGGDAARLNDLLQELYAQLESREGQFLTGLDTGFTQLNEMTSGLQEGEMIIVAGRPSMGKTAFSLNLAEHMAVTGKLPVAFYSLEMSKQQLAQRLLCSCSGVDSHKLRRNMLGADDFAHLAKTMGQLSDCPLYIDDTPGLSLLALRAKARRMKSRLGLKAVFVDYLQLMSAPGSESRQQEVSVMSRGIKALARELGVPVVCLSQLNRSPEGREDHRPRMSDLRESGSIEQDADVVMMLHREEYYHASNPDWAQENPDKVGTAEVILSKQRNGPTGTVHLQFNAASTRFNNLAPQSMAQPPF
ncbi:MAG: replicative DNA helicase [Phycisphaeraceae bacterium]|nr:replicative DNA helicase [Phycisphaeraceae bacterium]